MPTYAGHANWSQWNVSLWINSDEHLYNMAREYVRQHGVRRAARKLQQVLPNKTPDGARYSLVAIRNAISDIL